MSFVNHFHVFFSVYYNVHNASHRQDWSMMQFLVKLEAIPLVVNSSSRTPLELLGIKVHNYYCFPSYLHSIIIQCFPQQHFHELKQKGLICCFDNNVVDSAIKSTKRNYLPFQMSIVQQGICYTRYTLDAASLVTT